MRLSTARVIKRITQRESPVPYEPRVARQIVLRIAEGETLKAICESRFMPHPSTVYDWKDAHPEFAKAYARAQLIGNDMQAEDCIAIAEEVDGKDEVPKAKLRIATRLDILERRDARYSKRQNVTHSGSLSLAALIEESYQAPAIEGTSTLISDDPEGE